MALDCCRVRRVVIGHDDLYIGADVFLDVFSQRSRLDIFGVEESQIATALANTNDHFLVLPAPTANVTLSALSADIGFIHLNFAVHEFARTNFVHRVTHAMTEIPCRLVRDTKRALELMCAHTLLGFYEQQDRKEPCLERQVRIVENRLSSDAKLIAAINTLHLFLRRNVKHALALAAQAFDAMRPAEPLQQFAALVIGRIEGVNIN